MSGFEVKISNIYAMSNKEDRDINEVFDEITLTEDRINVQSYEKGYKDGVESGNTEGYHLGYHRGSEIGAELGYYFGVLSAVKTESQRNKKLIDSCLELIQKFPHTNDENCDIFREIDHLRATYRKTCAQLKINGKFSETDCLSF